MGSHQLPPIGNEEVFEELVCDLFNEIESTNTFKRFGRKGHQQKGIDIFSSEKDIVIQCKKKDLSRKEIIIRKELLDDIENDLDKIIEKRLGIKFSKLYFISTYKDHPDVDELCEYLKEERGLDIDIHYWGWDTIESRILDSKNLLKKYFKNFVIDKPEIEAVFLRNRALKRRIEKDFADWLNYAPKKRRYNSMMILRAYDGTQYPHSNKPDEYGEYSWFGAEIKSLYYQGMEFIFGIEEIKVYEDDTWDFKSEEEDLIPFRKVKVAKVGQINFSDIVDYDINGDELYISPHIFCKFIHKGTPFEAVYFYSIADGPVEYFYLD